VIACCLEDRESIAKKGKMSNNCGMSVVSGEMMPNQELVDPVENEWLDQITTNPVYRKLFVMGARMFIDSVRKMRKKGSLKVGDDSLPQEGDEYDNYLTNTERRLKWLELAVAKGFADQEKMKEHWLELQERLVVVMTPLIAEYTEKKGETVGISDIFASLLEDKVGRAKETTKLTLLDMGKKYNFWKDLVGFVAVNYGTVLSTQNVKELLDNVAGFSRFVGQDPITVVSASAGLAVMTGLHYVFYGRNIQKSLAKFANVDIRTIGEKGVDPKLFSERENVEELIKSQFIECRRFLTEDGKNDVPAGYYLMEYLFSKNNEEGGETDIAELISGLGLGEAQEVEWRESLEQLFARLGKIETKLSSLTAFDPSGESRKRKNELLEEYQTILRGAAAICVGIEYLYPTLSFKEEEDPIFASRMKAILGKRVTRRQFLRGAGTLAGATTLIGIAAKVSDPNRVFGPNDSEFDMLASNLRARRESVVGEPFYLDYEKATEKWLAAMRPYVDQNDQRQVEQYLTLEGLLRDDPNYIRDIQYLAVVFFTNYESDLKQIDESVPKLVRYEKFYNERFVPLMMKTASDMQVDWAAMVAMWRWAGNNLFSWTNHLDPFLGQKGDVEETRIQLVYGAVERQLQRLGMGIFTDVAKAANYNAHNSPVNRAYDPVRVASYTLRSFDVEPIVMAEAVEYIVKQGIAPLQYQDWFVEAGEWDAMENMTDTYRDLEREKKRLREMVSAYAHWLEINSNKDRFNMPLVEMLRDSNHPLWVETPFVVGGSFLENLKNGVEQTTHYTRMWAWYCELSNGGIPEDELVPLAGWYVRRDIQEIADKRGVGAAFEALVADQIEFGWFADFLKKYGGNDELSERVLGQMRVVRYQAGRVRDAMALSYNRSGKNELKYEHEIIMGNAIVKWYQDKIWNYPILSSLAKDDPGWITFLALSLREIAPLPLLAKEDNYPRLAEVDPPYAYTEILSRFEEVASLLKRRNPNEETTTILQDLINGLMYGFPDDIKNNPLIIELEKDMMMKYYSAVQRAMGITTQLIDYRNRARKKSSVG